MSDQGSFDPSVPTFKWDRDALVEELDAQKVALRDARKGDPRPNDTAFPFYNRVKDVLERVLQGGQSDLQSQISSEQQQLGAVQSLPSDLKRELDSTTLKLQQICRDGLDNADSLGREVQATEDEYVTFVEENDLDHRVANPKKTLGLWLIMVLALVELLVNGWSLGTAHVDGFVGAIYEILLFTFFNVAVGIAMGWLWRQGNKNPFLFRSFVVVLIVIVCFFGYIFAHYRDALVTLQSVAATDVASFLDTWGNLFTTAWDTAFSDDWVPNTMPSFILMLACILISTLVAIEWYRHDDPYPKFGPLSRKREAARRKYEASVKEVRERLTARAEEAKAFCDRKLTDARLAQQIPDRVADWGEKFGVFVSQLMTFAHDQLDEYRRVNRQSHAWPSQLDQQIDEFRFDENLSKVPRLAEGSNADTPKIDDVNEIVSKTNRIVDFALDRYSSDVFPPSSALHPKHEDYERYKLPYNTLERIKDEVDQLKDSDARSQK